ncbi:hypothetical protein HID58_071521 [Brassica napus]|uniref:Uncharacterized protein n=1 Tax=Brassica napus TaxID=3708 RepID=A0ABQ7Z1V3_BRANA|nr:hypothetical protein HID58_071521 [Brassica napus]
MMVSSSITVTFYPRRKMKMILTSETMDIPDGIAMKVHAKVIKVEAHQDTVTGKRQLKIDSWLG